MTVQEFKKRVYDKGETLSILDNQVVKVADYEHFHPGGIFTLKKNYGRDISKYFIGAYKLANQVDNEILWNHSAGAVTQVSGMCIANLTGQKGRTPWKSTVTQRQKVCKIATCFELKANDLNDKNSVKDWKHWYDSVDMIGRHFLVYSKENIGVKRQYTICNSIEEKVYKYLISLCDQKMDGTNEVFEPFNKIVSTNDKSSIYVTCKDYHTKHGVAT